MSEEKFLDGSISEEYASETWNIDRTIEKLKTMASTQEKIRFLQNELIAEQQIILEIGIPLKKFRKAVPNYKKYIKWCELEIKRLELELRSIEDEQALGGQLPATNESSQEEPETFQEIFTQGNWQKYIFALCEVESPALKIDENGNFIFIGSQKKHKGVVCSWIKDLQMRGIIKRNISRSQLATILNNEIKGLNLGRDGKTLDNTSKTYRESYLGALLERTK
jgi:hypothetical protein